MNPSKANRQTLSFVLRLWLESAAEADVAHSRGQLEVVASGETFHFNDLSEILPILRAWVARETLLIQDSHRPAHFVRVGGAVAGHPGGGG